MRNPNRPTLWGYLELLFKVFATMIVLIFWGVFIAAVAMAIPFLLSLICVLALAAAGAFVFTWEYVWVGTIFFLILIGMAID